MVDSTLLCEIGSDLKKEKKELRHQNRKDKTRLNYAKKVQDDHEF